MQWEDGKINDSFRTPKNGVSGGSANICGRIHSLTDLQLWIDNPALVAREHGAGPRRVCVRDIKQQKKGQSMNPTQPGMSRRLGKYDGKEHIRAIEFVYCLIHAISSSSVCTSRPGLCPRTTQPQRRKAQVIISHGVDAWLYSRRRTNYVGEG